MFAIMCPNPACRSRLSIDDKHLGKITVCRRCSFSFVVTEAEPSSPREGTHAEPSNLEYDGELDTSWRALVQTVVLLLVLIGSAVGAGIYIVDRLQHEREAFAKKAEPVSPAQARPG